MLALRLLLGLLEFLEFLVSPTGLTLWLLTEIYLLLRQASYWLF